MSLLHLDIFDMYVQCETITLIKSVYKEPGISSVTGHLPSDRAALGSNPSTHTHCPHKKNKVALCTFGSFLHSGVGHVSRMCEALASISSSEIKAKPHKTKSIIYLLISPDVVDPITDLGGKSLLF